MANVTFQLTDNEMEQILQAYNVIRNFIEKIISPNELYLQTFLEGLHEAQTEVEAGEFEEVKTFDDFIR